MAQTEIRIATRKSPLALWQANYVKNALLAKHENVAVEPVPMSTMGDKILDAPLAKVGGKGLFVKELEKAMLDNEADIAVHSMKDVPYELPDEFEIGAILARENPFDAFVSMVWQFITEQPPVDLYPKIWIDYVVILAIRFEPYFFYNQ